VCLLRGTGWVFIILVSLIILYVAYLYKKDKAELSGNVQSGKCSASLHNNNNYYNNYYCIVCHYFPSYLLVSYLILYTVKVQMKLSLC
jgi:hypothetical protein